MPSSAIQSMRSIDRFLQEVAAEKRAAEAHTEPGSVGGGTTHPVKNVDDSTEEATEGARAAENTADVKADQGPASVESTPENVAAKKASARKKLAVDGKSEGGSINPPGTASEDQLQIGTKKEPTGQDPAVETSSAKAEKEDATGGRLGNTTHPARTNNGELDGYKYAEMPIEQLAKVASDMGNHLLAKLAELKGDQHKLDVNSNGKIEGSDLAALRGGKKKDDHEEDEKEATDLAGQAGWELAGLLSGNFDKQAADSLVRSTLEEIIKTASEDADKVATFLASYSDEMSKKAEGEMPAGVDPAAMMGGDPAAEAGAEEAAMADAMTGGEGAGAGGDDVEQLAAVLEQLGISPEELEAAMAGGAGGEEMPEGAEDDTAGAAPGMEVEASDRRAKAKPATAKQAAAKKGAAEKSVRDYIQEVLERSRR